MQTTLLGLAIALILALIAALAGPLLIDWGRFRPALEAHATQLVGVPVRITGTIRGAVLPTPSLTLHGIEVGAAEGESLLRARSLAVEFKLGALVRGEWRAAEMQVAGPEFSFGVDSAGRAAFPKLAGNFDPDALSIDRLNVEDGRAILTDARSGTRLVLDKLRFSGDVRSLAGPFKGEGTFNEAGQVYAYRLAAGRAGGDGTTRLRLNLDPSEQPFTIEAEGAFAVENGEPRFDGTFDVARFAGVALASGRTVVNDPWRLHAAVKVTAAAALLQQIEFQYGPEERAVKLNGTAEVRFGSKPRLDGLLSALQADLDRAFPSRDAQRLPFIAVKMLSDSFAAAWRPAIPVRLGVSINAAVIAGATVQNVRGDITSDGENWNLEAFEFRAPGITQIALSGRLQTQAGYLAFMGPVSIDSFNPGALMAWLEGRGELASSRMNSLRARGDVTAGGDRLAIDRLKAEINHKAVEGRLAYAWPAAGRPARLEADLSAAELDIDALVAFANAARGGTTFEAPGEIALGMEIGRATIAGIEARKFSARILHDAQGLKIERFAVADLGGAGMEASGQVDTGSSSPRGKITFALDVRDFTGITALTAKLGPGTADTLRGVVAGLPPTKLNGALTIEGGGTRATLAVEGRSAGLRLSLLGEAIRSPEEATSSALQTFAAGDVRWQGKLEADNGGALMNVLGLGKVVAVDKRPGQLEVLAEGPLGGALRLDVRLAAGGLDASAKGDVRLKSEGPEGNLRLAIAAADIQPLRAAQSAGGLPLALNGNLVLAGRSLSLDDFSGMLAGADVRGRLGLVFAEPLRFDGRVEANLIDPAGAIAALIGMPVRIAARADSAAWSSEPFGQGFFKEIEGRMEFAAGRAAFTPTLVLQQAKGQVTVNRSEIAITAVEGTLADGKAAGQLVLRKDADELHARGRIQVTAADAATLLPGDEQASVAGRLNLHVDIEGAGRSPMGVIGSLSGNGVVSLERAQFARLNPRAFDAATHAIDQGITADNAKMADLVSTALASDRLAIPSAEGIITINEGQVRLANTVARGEGADLTMAGSVDLIEGTLNSRLTLSGGSLAPGSPGQRPAISVSLKGPPASPKRSLDLSALTAWLTLRAVEQQSKNLEAMEAARHAPPTEKPKADQAPPLPSPIDIAPAPGAAPRKPAQVPPGAAVSKPVPAKPALSGPVPVRRMPLDLSPSPN